MARFRKWVWRPATLGYSILGIVVTVLGIPAFYWTIKPRISVEPSVNLVAGSPISSLFALENQGQLAIHSIYPSFLFLEAKLAGGRTFKNMGFSNWVNYPHLAAGRKVTMDWPRVNSSGVEVESALLQVTVVYRPSLYWWSEQQSFKFVMVKTASGEQVWLPVAD